MQVEGVPPISRSARACKSGGFILAAARDRLKAGLPKNLADSSNLRRSSLWREVTIPGGNIALLVEVLRPLRLVGVGSS